MMNRIHKLLLAGMLAVTAAAAGITAPQPASAAVQATYYASPQGGGTSCTEASPCSLQGVKSKVASSKGSMSGDIVVYLRGGTYNLTSPLTFTPSDSGTNGYRIYYQNYPGETPVISGGKTVTGWSQVAGTNLYKATVTGLGSGSANNFRQLYVNGVRAARAQTAGTVTPQNWHYDGNGNRDGFIVNDADLGYYANAGDMELHWVIEWRDTRLLVDSIVSAGAGKKAIIMKQPYFADMLTMGTGFANPDYNTPFRIENAYELLDSPGEWYYKRSTNELFYYPKNGESVGTSEFVIPVAESLLNVTGTKTAGSSNPNARSGSRALKIAGSTKDAGALQTITGLSPNTTYTLTGWGKTENGVGVLIGVKDYGGTEKNASVSSASYSQSAAVTFTTGASNTSATIYVWKLGASGDAYVDDLDVRSGGGGNLLANPSFESQLSSWNVPVYSAIVTSAEIPPAFGYVENLTFKGIAFRHTGYLKTSQAGAKGWQEPELFTGPASSGTYYQLPGAVNIDRATGIVLERNRFENLGASGVAYSTVVRQSKLIGNVIRDVSAIGVVAAYSLSDNSGIDDFTANNLDNNYIADIGLEYAGSSGISVAAASNGGSISHNELENLPYTGIRLGSGLKDPTTYYSNQKNNKVEYNKVSNFMSVARDGGGIYTQGQNPGTTIRYNHFDRMNNVYGALYLDGGSRYMTVSNNVTSSISNYWLQLTDWQSDGQLADYNTVQYNYTNQPNNNQLGGPNNVINNNTIVSGSNWPQAALDIMAGAGLEAGYKDIKSGIGGNLLGNSGFESGGVGPWTSYGTAAIVTGNARTGTYAVKLTGVNSNVEQVVTGLSPNTTYTLRGWGKQAATGQNTYVGVKQFGGTEVNQVITSTDYQQVSVTFTTGSSSTSAKIYYWKADGGDSYGDDFQLVQGAPANLLGNAGFESGSLGPWTTYGTSAIVTGNARTGTYSVKLTGMNSNVEQVITGLTPNTTYTLKGWGKQGASGQNTYVGVKQFGGTEVNQNITGTGYQQVTVTFTTGSSSTSAKIYFWKADGGDSYGDDFELYG